MITMADVDFASNPDNSIDGMLIAFSIDNTVVHIMGTYTWFYDLVTAGHSVIESEAAEGTFVVSFVDENDNVVEVFECSELMSALLRSAPKVHVVLTEPKPPIEELGIKRYLEVGWGVTEDGEFTPPEGWEDPRNNPAPVLTEEQKEELRSRGYNI